MIIKLMFIVRNLRNTESIKKKMKVFCNATKMQPMLLCLWNFLTVRMLSLLQAPFPRCRKRFSRSHPGLFLVSHLRGPRCSQPQQADAVLSAPSGVQISRETFPPALTRAGIRDPYRRWTGGARSTQLLIFLWFICGSAFRKHPKWNNYFITTIVQKQFKIPVKGKQNPQICR